MILLTDKIKKAFVTAVLFSRQHSLASEILERENSWLPNYIFLRMELFDSYFHLRLSLQFMYQVLVLATSKGITEKRVD